METDIECYKVLKIYFSDWFDILYNDETARLFETAGITEASPKNFDLIKPRMTKDMWRQLYDNTQKAVIVPKYQHHNFQYDLYGWNYWNRDATGTNYYLGSNNKPERTSMLPNAILALFQRIYDTIAPRLESNEIRAEFQHELLHLILNSKRWDASEFAGFHCHRTIDHCIYENYDNNYNIMQTINIFDTVVCRVQLQGMVFAAEQGYIGEQLQFQSIWSPLPEALRRRWAEALGYIEIGNLYDVFDYTVWLMKREMEQEDPEKAAEMFTDTVPLIVPELNINPKRHEILTQLIGEAGV